MQISPLPKLNDSPRHGHGEVGSFQSVLSLGEGLQSGESLLENQGQAKTNRRAR